ncbi:MAG: chromosomal replication initiator protein DnaA [Pseudomonadales bacterium]|nr:chromosomal replication initiator protein DnaA [Pseudomonadales bacterium]
MYSQILSPEETQAIWQETCGVLHKTLSPAVYNTWIVANPLTTLELQEKDVAVATITSPTAFHATNVKKNLHAQIQTALNQVVGRTTTLQYEVGNPYATSQPPETSFTPITATVSGVEQPPEKKQQKSPQSPRVEDLFSESTMQSAARDRLQSIIKKVGLRPDYTFETFAVSSSNEMAHAAATAVSNRPGEAYNPLFLYGGVGVGKTHLMHAIGNNILHNNPEATLVYCSGEEFTNDIVTAIRTKKASHFKQKFRSADVLFIDDIQFIAGKNAVQEEFFHTFNTLIKQSSQVVLTSDRPPHEINLLEDRLRSRFEAGLMIDIGQPSFELRTAICLVKAKAAHLNISIEIAKIIAAKVESARKIEGIITSIRSEVELKGKQISAQLIESILQTEVIKQKPRITASPSDVIKVVASHYRVKQIAIKGKSRVKNLVTARHTAMYIMKDELSLPLAEIGKWFSSRDHTSVLHAVNKITGQLSEDQVLQQDVAAIRTTLLAK